MSRLNGQDESIHEVNVEKLLEFRHQLILTYDLMIGHTEPLLRKVAKLAYAQATDDMLKAMDKARVVSAEISDITPLTVIHGDKDEPTKGF